mmetsp:Transcript_17347/g.28732  ORF Transcript_17347/g.28732 Transcript_17347/m.28732 type:complete len:210 (-) Transcript_17347:31-660(-)|eukprot:CAMPEP_0184644094 /NCGR_PEP_ID=MMETSP0308-20130426/862_1 /TAXON_ID=38269 /ORGANISM="Gloeochaete witrockiana, Strain SAG 46.84" /LENGTH=209 /DNA_ID=CAMNT_0027072423 /DNA_START=223 /DNA_END=852 /DNA_ORIENTATION=-
MDRWKVDDGQLVGTKPITVRYEKSSPSGTEKAMEGMKGRIKELEEKSSTWETRFETLSSTWETRFETLEAELRAPGIRNLATQILLIAIGKRDLTSEPNEERHTENRFRKLEFEDAKRLAEAINDVQVGWELVGGDDFVLKEMRALNSLVEDRNTYTHPSTLAALREQIDDAKKFIGVNAAIRNSQSSGCKVITNFERVHSAFEDRFNR